MREKIIRKLTGMTENNIPAAFRNLQLQILMNMTARGFGVKSRNILFRSTEEALKEYASFTKHCTETVHADPQKLYQEAYRTGNRIRKLTGLSDPEDIQRLVFLLYRNIDIDMDGKIPGQIRIRHCYFSRYYTPVQCAYMSSVDSGFIAGLNDGGRLVFTERITEGCERCAACFTKEKQS